MELRADALLPFPRPLVYATYRDKLPELVPFLSNVRSIEVTSRADEGKVTRVVNIWHGGGEIPAAARAVLSESMLSWTDRATWLEDEYACEWTIETHAFSEAVRCKGKNRFVEDGSGTRLEIRGELVIEASKIKGVPRLLAGTVGRTVEDFLVKKIGPNLVETAAGVRKFLEAQKG